MTSYSPQIEPALKIYCKDQGLILSENEISPFHQLPLNVIFTILSNLPIKNIDALRRTCRSFKILSDDQQTLLLIANKIGLRIETIDSEYNLKEIIDYKLAINWNQRLPIPPPAPSRATLKRHLEEEDDEGTLTAKRLHPETRLQKIQRRMTQPIPPTAAPRCSKSTLLVPSITPFSTRICNYSVGVASSVGYRPTMEDYYLLTEVDHAGLKIPVFAVMDGHGGSTTATILKQHFVHFLTKNLASFDLANANDEQMHDLWKRICNELETFIEDAYLIPSNDRSGSTLTCAVVINNIIWVINTGDSRTVLSVNGEPFQLSLDANFKDEMFAKTIRKLGGVVERDAQGTKRLNDIAMPRAFGDLKARGKLLIGNTLCTGLTHHPKITKCDLSQFPVNVPKYLLLGSDGLWNRVSSEGAAKKVCEFDLPEEAAKILVTEAFQRGTRDNTTLMVVKLSQNNPLHTVFFSAISEFLLKLTSSF